MKQLKNYDTKILAFDDIKAVVVVRRENKPAVTN